MSFAILGFVMSLTTATFAADPIPLKQGERIVMLGDSITQAGVRPDGYVTQLSLALAEKYPEKKITVMGAGISGNKVPDLQKRLEKDVIAKKPTLVVIYIGINDVWHGQKNPANGTSKEAFRDGLNEIIDKIQDAGARVILCTPSVIGEKKPGTNSLDAKLDEFAEISRDVAKKQDVVMCDLRKAFQDHLTKNNPDDKDRGILTGDGVHLTKAGNEFVAETMLKVLDAK